MPDLVAQGEKPSHTWRRNLPNATVKLGRREDKSDWVASWDNQISGLHALLTWQNGQLLVRREGQTKNEIFFRGVAKDEFTLEPGEQFVIGKTTFRLEETLPAATPDLPDPISELTCSPQELHSIPYVDPSERIEVLAALPGFIRLSPSNQELEGRVVDVLLRGIPRAEMAAVVRLKREPSSGAPMVEVRQERTRAATPEAIRPSRRLVSDAIERRRQSVMHIWSSKERTDQFTVTASLDWALCVPLSDDASAGLGLYVAGRILERMALEHAGVSGHDLLKSDLKFAELVADIFGSLRQVLDLQRRQALLARFFSRPVLVALAEEDMEEVLRPRQTDVTVLFCDLRGSCRLAEEGQEHLPDLWNRISEALTIMAGSILDQDGVVGDFQGDSAMGFWGWPLPCEDRAERAARTALTIRRRFAQAAQQPSDPLAGITCGIGIASGPAMAGKLGTQEQFKVDVFGPTVNLAARLESMTKVFRVPILLDECTSRMLESIDNNYWGRCRRLAKVQPYGMQTTLTISELLPPAVEPDTMAERKRKDYQAAFDGFLEGRWKDAAGLLQRLQGDGPSDFLVAFMNRNRQSPPSGWNGTIKLESK
jgi:adenylate cyclase